MKKIYNGMKMMTLVLLISVLGGCNAWMDIYPENQQTSDNFWNSKEEVQQVLMGAYTQLRNNCRKMIQWGELRGDGLKLGASKDASEEKIKNLEINTDNSICKWDDFYKVIARANSVIRYSDQALKKDVTFTQELSNSYIAEAVFLRSLCYFYLVRTFGEVPLVLEPYVDDSYGYDVPKSSEAVILDQLIADLKAYAPMCKYTYEGDWQPYGRATRWAYYALLADVYLWKGDYQNAVQMCDAVMNAGKFSLVKAEEWYSLFYPGNSCESIFELQWAYKYDQSNSLFDWFFNNTNNTPYLVSASARALFEGDDLPDHDDVRGPNNTYLTDNTYDSKLWKYAGTGIYKFTGEIRGSSERDANFIVYRYSDVVLMRMEALTMMGGNNANVITMINDFRQKRGTGALQIDDSDEKNVLMAVINERFREFVGEGKRWFDILRVSKRGDKYEDYVTDALLLGIDARLYQLWKSRLSDPNSRYLPVHRDEVNNSNGVVIQNPYYAGED